MNFIVPLELLSNLIPYLITFEKTATLLITHDQLISSIEQIDAAPTGITTGSRQEELL